MSNYLDKNDDGTLLCKRPSIVNVFTCQFSGGCSYFLCIHHRVFRFLTYRIKNFNEAGILYPKTNLLRGYQEKEDDIVIAEDRIRCSVLGRMIDFKECLMIRGGDGQIVRCYMHGCDWAYRCAKCGSKHWYKYGSFCLDCQNGTREERAVERLKFSKQELFILAILKDRNGKCLQTDIANLILKKFNSRSKDAAVFATCDALNKLQKKGIARRIKISRSRNCIDFTGKWSGILLKEEDSSFLESLSYEYSDLVDEQSECVLKCEVIANSSPRVQDPVDQSLHDTTSLKSNVSMAKKSVEELLRGQWKNVQEFTELVGDIPHTKEAQALRILAECICNLAEL